MPFLKSFCSTLRQLPLVLGLGALLSFIALPQAALSSPCSDFELIATAETASLRAAEKARLLPSSPLRSRIIREIEAEKAKIETAIDQLGGSGRINSNEVSRLSERLHAWEEVADAPPVRLDPSAHHDPSSPAFRGGGSRTTPLPSDWETAFTRALPEAGSRGTTWWARVGNTYYRYQGSVISNQTVLHWNGMTSGNAAIRLQDVPNTIRRTLE